MKTILTGIGLALDVIGAVILIRGEIKTSAAIIRQFKVEIKGSYLQRCLGFLAKSFGSNNLQNTESYVIESFSEKFIGFILLIAGFICQLIAVFLKSPPNQWMYLEYIRTSSIIYFRSNL